MAATARSRTRAGSVGFSYWFMPRAMGLWVAIELMTDVGNREPWVVPRDE